MFSPSMCWCWCVEVGPRPAAGPSSDPVFRIHEIQRRAVITAPRLQPGGVTHPPGRWRGPGGARPGEAPPGQVEGGPCHARAGGDWPRPGPIPAPATLACRAAGRRTAAGTAAQPRLPGTRGRGVCNNVWLLVWKGRKC